MADGIVARMRSVAEYREMVKMLRQGSVGSLIFGGLAVVSGLMGLSESPLNVALLLIGVVLLADSVVGVAAPSPRGMILRGVAFSMVGIWNLGLTVLVLALVGPQGDEFFIVLGLFQIGWGIGYFARYPRFSDLAAGAPTKEELARFDEVAKEIAKADPKERNDVLDLDVAPFVGSPQRWRVQLGESAAVFVQRNGHRVNFAARDEVGLEPGGRAALSKKVKVAIKLPGRTLKGSTTPEHLERLQQWKAALAAPPEGTPAPEPPAA